MTTTTVLSEDATTIVSDDSNVVDLYRFSWSSVFAGALVATGLILFLLALGAGVGLSLVSTQTATVTFLTLGGIYFFAAQTFGFAAGGYLTGRLLTPAIETTRESEFRAGSHGLVSWALAVVVSTAIVGAAMLTGTGAGALVAASTPKPVHGLSSDSASYWVDVLFRGASPATRASVTFPRYAQIDDGYSSDVIDAGTPPPEPAPAPAAMMPSGAPTIPVQTTTLAPLPDARSTAADKAEVNRILIASMADGGRVSSEDKAYIATLIAHDATLSRDTADARVKDTEARIYAELKQKADNARKVIMYASLWSALALLFGAIAATVAAMAARWEEDRLPLGVRREVTRTQL